MTKNKKQITVEDVKKLATPDELELYSYVEEHACKVSKTIANKIQTDPYAGGIILVYGPQNAGKTIVAIEVGKKITNPKLNIIKAQPKVDRPDVPENLFFSISRRQDKNVFSFADKRDIDHLFTKYDVVIVDEINFIPHKLQIYFLRELMRFIDRGGWFVGIGMLYTAQGGEFLLPALLKERAKLTYELTATCQKCGRRGARWNQRLINGSPSDFEDPDYLAPSDKVTYEPRCDECHVTIG